MRAWKLNDYTTAKEKLSIPAEQGNENAQYNLAVMYNIGQGVPQDYKQAVYWYRLAAAQGNVSAQYALSLKHGKGQGVVQNYIKAYMWSNIAAANGSDKAITVRDLAEKIITQQQVSEAQKMAKRCLESKYKQCE